MIFLSPLTYIWESKNFLGRIKFFSILLLRAGNFNPDCLIHYSMWTLLISCLIHCFLDKVQKKQKPVFKIRESLPFLYINLKWCTKFQISRLHTHDSVWLNFIQFSGYKCKIRLVSRLRKREDQALISISKIPKFPAQMKV